MYMSCVYLFQGTVCVHRGQAVDLKIIKMWWSQTDSTKFLELQYDMNFFEGLCFLYTDSNTIWL